MRGDYSGKADDKHYERILRMHDKMLNLLVKRRMYTECAESKNLEGELKYAARFTKEKTESEIDELREEMRQQ